jgi:hypothetical protein
LPETHIQVPFISATTGKPRIEVEHINGQGGPIYPQLFVPLQISVASGEVSPRMGRGGMLQAPEDMMQDCSLLRISGALIIGSGQVAQFQSPPIRHFSRTSPEVQVSLAIPLDLQRLQLIEAQRVGDIALRFDCTFEYARHTQVPRTELRPPIDGFESNYTQLIVTIPQSHWVKVLSGLGYGKIALLEVPTAQHAVGDLIVGVLDELTQAQEAMVQGDYPKVLGQCRKAIERLANAKKYKGTPKNGPGTNPSFDDKIDYLLSTLPGVPTGDRGKNFARRLKDLWWLTSRPEHPDSPHFTRDDAELTLHHTIADLSYLGKFLARATEAEIQAAAQVSVAAGS